MSQWTNIVYPKNGAQLLDGGLNTKFEKAILADNESPDCLNVDFSNGAVATRYGSTLLNTTTVGSFVGDGLYTRRDDGGTETMVAFHGGSMRAWNVSTFISVPSAMSVFSAGVRVGATQYKSHMFVGNGNVIPYKYNGSDFTRHGVYPATNLASFVSVSTAGSVDSGAHSWKFTYLNSLSVEGDLSGATTLTVSALSRVKITSIPVAPQSFGINSRRIYRTAVSAVTYFLVGTISDNTTTSYEDAVADTTLILGVTAPSDNGVPPNYAFCFYLNNRLFVNDPANPNYVWYSELGEPFTFPSSNFFKVGDASSDLVKGFDAFENSLVVFCENSQFINYMADPSDDSGWRQVRVKSNYGSKSPFGSFQWDNKVGFPAMQNSKLVGFGAVAGNTLAPSSTLLTVSAAGSDLLSDKIEPNIFNIVDSQVGNISSIVYKNRAYITVTDTSGSTNNRIYLFDFSLDNLSKKQKFSWVPLTGMNAAQFAILGGELYYVSSTANGYVYKMEQTAYNDNDSAINSYFWTKEFSGLPGHEELIKDFRKIRILLDLAGSYYMGLTWKVDSDKGVGQTKQVDLTPGGSLWGTMRFATDEWGGGFNQSAVEVSLGQTFGKRIQFKFDNKNTANQRFKIHRISFSYNIRGQK